MVDRTSKLKLVVDAVSAVASVERLNAALGSLGATANRTASQLGALLKPLSAINSAAASAASSIGGLGRMAGSALSAGFSRATGAALSFAGFLGGGFLSILGKVGNFIENTLIEGLRTFIRWSVRALAAFAAELVHVQVQMDKFKSIMTVTTAKSGIGAVFQDLTAMANTFGVAIGDQLFKEFGKFRTVMLQAGMDAKKFQEVFAGFAQVSNVYHLDTQDAQYAILALTQMVSKGKVSMEELRRQLAERIPGAMQFAAAAFQTTTGELEKLITKGWVNPMVMVEGIIHEMAYQTQEASKVAVNSMEARLNRLNNAWFEMKRTLLEGGIGQMLEEFFDTLTAFINAAVDSGLIDKVAGMFSKMGNDLIAFFQDTSNLNAWWDHFSQNWGDILLGALITAMDKFLDYISQIQIRPEVILTPDPNASLSMMDAGAAIFGGARLPPEVSAQKGGRTVPTYGDPVRSSMRLNFDGPDNVGARDSFNQSAELFSKIGGFGVDPSTTAKTLIKNIESMNIPETAQVTINSLYDQVQKAKELVLKRAEAMKAEGAPDTWPQLVDAMGTLNTLENLQTKLNKKALTPFGGTVEQLTTASGAMKPPPDDGADKAAAAVADKAAAAEERRIDALKKSAEQYRMSLDPMYAYRKELEDIWAAMNPELGDAALAPETAALAIERAAERLNTVEMKRQEQLTKQAEAYTMLYDPMAAYKAELESIIAVQEKLSPEVTAKAVEAAYEKFKAATEGYSMAADIIKVFDQSFQGMLNGVLAGTQSIADGFEDMAKVIIAQVLKIMAYQAVISAFGEASGGGFGETFANSVGMGAAAKGTAFDGGNVIPFAKGGIVNRPTKFNMGLMGEAGPEAIMPLTRGKQGKLGVAAAPVQVTVNNMAPGVRVNTSEGEGGLTLDIVMDQVSAAIRKGGNPVANAMEDSYSLGRGRAVY